jgi:ABC-type lipoprotein release transport system permease subunit
MVYGVSSRDMLTFVAVTALLLLVAFVASLSPALRATRISPLAVLRDE